LIAESSGELDVLVNEQQERATGSCDEANGETTVCTTVGLSVEVYPRGCPAAAGARRL